MLITLKLLLQSGHYRESSDSIYNMIVTSFFVISGWIYSKYVLVLVLNVVMAGSNSENKFKEMSAEVKAFCDAKKVSQGLRNKIELFFKYKFQENYFNEEAIKQSTPASLSKEIMMHSCANLLLKVSLFREIPQLLLENIISCLRLEIYFCDDIIIEAGSTGDSMYFIAFGTAAIYSASGETMFIYAFFHVLLMYCSLKHVLDSGKRLGTVYDGAHFGEVSLLIKDQKRIASVVALDTCECYKLSQNDFHTVIEPHSKILRRMEQIALERIKIVTNPENVWNPMREKFTRCKIYRTRTVESPLICFD